MTANSQVASLTWFNYLPRLLPAPQALIKNNRAERLITSTGKVVAVYSGQERKSINHIAHVLHGEKMEDYTVRCISITKTGSYNPRAAIFGPVTYLALLGLSMTIALIGLSISQNDGMALLAAIILSSLSTLIGIGSHWELILSKRKVISGRIVPDGDVVIVYENGAMLVIKCDENIARELYWAPEKCKYRVAPAPYRLIALLGTLLLMAGIVSLGNAGTNMQVAFGAAYAIINAAYWFVSALPPKLHWDLGCYQIDPREYGGQPESANFTEALWKAIALAGDTSWADFGNVAPKTRPWMQWLADAQIVLQASMKRDEAGKLVRVMEYDEEKKLKLPEWDFQGALNRHLASDQSEGV